jgi:large subunit ribosomal protein LP0
MSAFSQALRPASTILMGKNTMMKRSIRVWCDETGSDKWACLLDHLVGNVGILFIEGEFTEIREEVLKFKIGAPARFGLVAMNDVFIKAGPTPLDPSQTSFFQVSSTCYSSHPLRSLLIHYTLVYFPESFPV